MTLDNSIFNIQYNSANTLQLENLDHKGYSAEISFDGDSKVNIKTIDPTSKQPVVSVDINLDTQEVSVGDSQGDLDDNQVNAIKSKGQQMISGRVEKYNIDWEVIQEEVLSILHIVNPEAWNDGVQYSFNTLKLIGLFRENLDPEHTVLKSLDIYHDKSQEVDNFQYPYIVDILTEDVYMRIDDYIMKAGEKYFLHPINDGEDNGGYYTELLNWDVDNFKIFSVSDKSYLRKIPGLDHGSLLWQKGLFVDQTYEYNAGDGPLSAEMSHIKHGEKVRIFDLSDSVDSIVLNSQGDYILPLSDSNLHTYKIKDGLYGNVIINSDDNSNVANAKKCDGFDSFYLSSENAAISQDPLTVRDNFVGRKLHTFTLYSPDGEGVQDVQDGEMDFLMTAIADNYDGDKQVQMSWAFTGNPNDEVIQYNFTDDVSTRIDANIIAEDEDQSGSGETNLGNIEEVESGIAQMISENEDQTPGIEVSEGPLSDESGPILNSDLI